MTKNQSSEPERQLSHYGFFRFTDLHWQEERENRRRFLEQLSDEIPELAERVHLYRIYPTRPDVDLMIWSASSVGNPSNAGDFFVRFGSRTVKWRKHLKPVDALWGFTRPSTYSTGKSAQELDPFTSERGPYLIVYPFAKTAEWYLMSREARQGMMNEHIRIGREYLEIRQLLLYSTGLQDQEFVVVYETENLAYFSELVTSLRDTEGRKYTLRDTPIYTAAYSPLENIVSEWT